MTDTNIRCHEVTAKLLNPVIEGQTHESGTENYGLQAAWSGRGFLTEPARTSMELERGETDSFKGVLDTGDGFGWVSPDSNPGGATSTQANVCHLYIIK